MSVFAYSDPDHQQTDWTSIHEKVCPLLVSIHSPPPLHTLQADRERHHRETLKKQVHIHSFQYKLTNYI